LKKPCLSFKDLPASSTPDRSMNTGTYGCPISSMISATYTPTSQEAPLQFYPGASQIREPDKDTRGAFDDNKPLGITLHYTASKSTSGTIRALAESGLKYHALISEDGRLIQTASLWHKTWHAGKAEWNGNSPNQTHWGIGVLNWGRLDDRSRAWPGNVVPTDQTRYRNGFLWEKATEAQEACLMLFIRWAVSRGIDPAQICGHDECCIPPGRKTDPGGIFSFSMDELRNHFLD